MTTTAAPTPHAPTAPAPAGSTHDFSLVIRLQDDYLQAIEFALDGVAPIVADEPAPLGQGRGPNPARLLGAAIGSCLGASLLFCLRKSRVELTDLRTTVEGTMVRNARGRLRIASLRVKLAPVLAEPERMGRCVELFEDFCVVTQSVREGIAIVVDIDTPA